MVHGVAWECQGCGHIAVGDSASLADCPECGAGHWRNWPRHEVIADGRWSLDLLIVDRKAADKALAAAWKTVDLTGWLAAGAKKAAATRLFTVVKKQILEDLSAGVHGPGPVHVSAHGWVGARDSDPYAYRIQSRRTGPE